MKKLIALSLFASLVLAAFPVSAQGPSLGVVTTASPAYVNSQTRPLSLDLFGNLRVLTTPSASATPTQVVGNVASGGVDSGNPVKTGCPYNATAPTVADTQRVDCQSTPSGEQRVAPVAPIVTPGDGITNSGLMSVWPTPGGNYLGGTLIPGALSFYYNGTTWDRARGNTAGAFAQGNIASGVADAGNPMKVGCVYNSTLPTFTTAQRADCQSDNQGQQRILSTAIGLAGTDGFSNTLLSAPQAQNSGTLSGRMPQSAGFLFNSASWDREFTCPSSAVVNVTAGNTTEIVALTASQIIRVCSMVLSISLAGTATVQTGTGSNCGTGTTALTGAMNLLTGGNISLSAANGSLLRSLTANAICVTAATGNVTGFLSYAKY